MLTSTDKIRIWSLFGQSGKNINTKYDFNLSFFSIKYMLIGQMWQLGIVRLRYFPTYQILFEGVRGNGTQGNIVRNNQTFIKCFLSIHLI
jgi:hypothetical protein